MARDVTEEEDGWSWEVVREVGEVVINHIRALSRLVQRNFAFSSKLDGKPSSFSNDSLDCALKIRGTGAESRRPVRQLLQRSGETSRWWGAWPAKAGLRGSGQVLNLFWKRQNIGGVNEWEELKTKFLVSFNWQDRVAVSYLIDKEFGVSGDYLTPQSQLSSCLLIGLCGEIGGSSSFYPCARTLSFH